MKKIIVFLNILIIGILIYFFRTPVPAYVGDTPQVPQEESTVPLLFTGDIMLGRYVEVLQKTSNLDPFGDTGTVLKTHITMSNLEGTIPMLHKPTPINGFSFSFPSSTPEYLQQHGVQAVSLANNHSFDGGASGYEETKHALDDAHISHFGGYSTTVPDYFQTTLGTTTVIVYGITMISSTWDEEAALKTTQLLRQEHPGAYLVAFIHWGNEYDLTQGKTQEIFAHKLIDKGVQTIIGSHPHVTQGIEVYKNAPIFYSLGNFIFDQYFSEDTQRGYMVSIDKKDEQLIFRLIPVMSVRSKTLLAGTLLSQAVLESIAKSSQQELQADIKKGQFVLKF